MGEQGEERQLTYRWVMAHAEEGHGGQFTPAAICLLTGTRLREENPDKLWIELEHRQRCRSQR